MTTETPTYSPLGSLVNSDLNVPFPADGVIVVTVKDIETRQIFFVTRYRSESNFLYTKTVLSETHPHFGRMIYWGPYSESIYQATKWSSIRTPRYLPYPPADGIAIGKSVEPVNQVPKFREWMRHITTFAHEIDMLWPEHSIMLREADNYNLIPGSSVRTTLHNLRNQFTLRYGRGICGYGYQRVTEWADLDPTEERWKTQQAGVQEDVEALCLTCDHAFWLRQFLHRHDPLPWINSVDSATTHPTSGQQYYRVPKVDRTNPKLWIPHATENITTVAGNAPVRWWKNQMINFGKAVDYFDENYASRD